MMRGLALTLRIFPKSLVLTVADGIVAMCVVEHVEGVCLELEIP